MKSLRLHRIYRRSRWRTATTLAVAMMTFLSLVLPGIVRAAPDTWTPTGSLSTARAGARASVMLADGRVLEAGGAIVDHCGPLPRQRRIQRVRCGGGREPDLD